MIAFAWVGALFAGIGVIMILFPRALGAAVCRAGKAAARGGPNRVAQRLADGIYNEAKAPRLVRVMGWVFVVQGLLLVWIGTSFR